MTRRSSEEERQRAEIRREMLAVGSYRVPANVSHIKWSKEEREQIETLAGQYNIMLDTLKAYKISLEGMPTWELVLAELAPEVLKRVRKLEEPALVIVPPVSRQTMVEAIDAHKVPGQKHETTNYKFGNDDLWSGGKPEATDAWEVAIVTGVRDVKADEAIRGTNYQRAKAWVKKYEGQGVDVINDARTYLALMMCSLQAGKPIDKENWTALNAKNLTESSLVAFGFWNLDRVFLNFAGPAVWYLFLRWRGSVRVM